MPKLTASSRVTIRSARAGGDASADLESYMGRRASKAARTGAPVVTLPVAKHTARLDRCPTPHPASPLSGLPHLLPVMRHQTRQVVPNTWQPRATLEPPTVVRSADQIGSASCRE